MDRVGRSREEDKVHGVEEGKDKQEQQVVRLPLVLALASVSALLVFLILFLLGLFCPLAWQATLPIPFPRR